MWLFRNLGATLGTYNILQLKCFKLQWHLPRAIRRLFFLIPGFSSRSESKKASSSFGCSFGCRNVPRVRLRQISSTRA